MLIKMDKAINTLKEGGVVAVPTETVYGLAAVISDPKAIELIFKTKARPFFDPLIVHVSTVKQAQDLVTWWPEQVEALAHSFWPGPLTLVLPKSQKVSAMITSGLDSVGLHMPRHPLTLELIDKLGVPLAAPSANKFGRTSPTSAEHVMKEFSQENVGVLDGGPCAVGLESTVLLVKPTNPPQLSILRAGHIKRTDIERELTRRGLAFTFVDAVEKKESPGHMKHHYMPQIPLIVCTQEPKSSEEFMAQVRAHLAQLPEEIEGVRLIRPQKINKVMRLSLSEEPTVAAREFYQKLRESAESGADVIYLVRDKKMSGENWEALNDRLTKAASMVLDG